MRYRIISYVDDSGGHTLRRWAIFRDGDRIAQFTSRNEARKAINLLRRPLSGLPTLAVLREKEDA
jgi:hypothetical protein